MTAGLISATSTITSAANITGGNILTAGLISATSNVQGGNIRTVGLVSATGNVTGNFFIGNGSQLTGITSSGGIVFTSQANTPPVSPNNGDFWFNTFTDIKYQYINDGTSNQWVDQSVPTSFATIGVGNITNTNANGVGNIGNATTYFNTVFAKATSAQYADLAENYLADAQYPPGTVVEFGGSEEVTITTSNHSSRIAGVVSTDPAYLMNAGQVGDYVVAVALTGRVPCQVVGNISKGDRIVCSDVPGVAMTLNPEKFDAGCIIGKALGSWNSDEIGVIEIVVGRN